MVRLIVALSWACLLLRCFSFSEIDHVTLAFDNVEWHSFAGRYRDSKIVFHDGSTCLEKTFKRESVFQTIGAAVGLVAPELFQQLCITNFQGSQVFALCEAAQPESLAKKCDIVGKMAKEHTSIKCGALDILGLCHPQMHTVVDEYQTSFVSLKKSGDGITEMEFYVTPDVNAELDTSKPLDARMTINGQGMNHGQATGVEIRRFSDAIDMDMLVLIAGKNLQAYAQNRQAKWITDKIARSVRKMDWQKMLESSPSIRKCYKPGQFMPGGKRAVKGASNCIWDVKKNGSPSTEL